MRRLPHRARNDERGFTMVEMLVVMTIMSLTLAAVLGAMNSLMNNERRQEALVRNQELVRFAMLDMARDLRSATGIATLASPTAYTSEIDAAIVEPSGTEAFVRWLLTGTTITRDVQSSLGGAVTSTKTLLTNVRNGEQAVALFSWYDSNNTLIDPAVRPTGDFSQCTIRLHVTIAANSEPGPLPFTEQSDIELRNRLPGGIGC